MKGEKNSGKIKVIGEQQNFYGDHSYMQTIQDRKLRHISKETSTGNGEVAAFMDGKIPFSQDRLTNKLVKDGTKKQLASNNQAYRKSLKQITEPGSTSQKNQTQVIKNKEFYREKSGVMRKRKDGKRRDGAS